MAEQTREERNREKQRVWTSHINAWKSSGLTQTEYCRQKDLIRHQFTYWKCKLVKKSAPVTFVPIMEQSLRSQPPHHNEAPIILIIDKYRIEIGEGFSPSTLSTLIRTLGNM